jgi:hypothetical protein
MLLIFQDILSKLEGAKLNCVCKICSHPLTNALLRMPEIFPTVALSSMAFDQSQKPLEFELFACEVCGHLQQGALPSLSALKPRYLWQRFREPEEHLDDLAAQIRAFVPKQRSQAKVFGVSWQDSSLLARLKDLDFQTLELDPQKDLGVSTEEGFFGIESIQAAFREAKAEETAQRLGPADVLVARDILEHAFHPLEFLKNLSTLVSDQGLIIVEVPGCIGFLRNQSHWLLWEHHISYFTAETLKALCESAGLQVASLKTMQLDAGEYLILMARKTSPPVDTSEYGQSQSSREVYNEFARSYLPVLDQIQVKLRALQGGSASGRKLFLYGANHVGHWWLNAYGVTQMFSGIIDDSSEKNGLFIPGSSLQIFSSDRLEIERNAVCLHLFGPRISEKIEQKLNFFRKNGGLFLNAGVLI